MSGIDKYKIIKEIGYGVIGTIYLVSKNKRKYALKVEKRLISEINSKYNSPVWNDIDFCLKVGNKYPDYFLKLYEYDVIKDCKHKQKRGEYNLLSENVKKYVDKLRQSKYCSRRIYSLVDMSLDKIYLKLSKDQMLSVMTQTAYAIYLMHKHGYVHRDLHNGNIGISKTDKKYLNIFGNKIPTYGKLCKLIDYGMVTHKKFHRESAFKKFMTSDVDSFLYNISKWEFWRKYWKKTIPHKEIDAKVLRHPKYKKLTGIVKTDKAKIILFEIIYQKEFQKIALGKNKKKTIYQTMYLEMPDVIYILNNMDNIGKIVKRLLTYFE
jgi:serine/threonine protein kinase